MAQEEVHVCAPVGLCGFISWRKMSYILRAVVCGILLLVTPTEPLEPGESKDHATSVRSAGPAWNDIIIDFIIYHVRLEMQFNN